MFDYEKRSPMDYGLYNAMYGDMWPTLVQNITNMSGPNDTLSTWPDINWPRDRLENK